MPNNVFLFEGLNDSEVTQSRKEFGSNTLHFKKQNIFWVSFKNVVKDPMVALLVLASIIYFISGKTGDGIFLLGAIILVAGISLYQDSRSRNAVEKLKALTRPLSKVIRNGESCEIPSQELVIGDFLIVEEGSSVSADGVLVHANDFSVNESMLTGESLAVSKNQFQEKPFIFHGTTVVSGMAVAKINAIGNATQLGKIGKSLEDIDEESTPLEIQIGHFVRILLLLGAFVFVLVWVIHYYKTANWLESLLKALTLAMSIIPEEIPVAFTTFMALGSWRLMKMGIIVKQMKTVETLGSATIICTDKTGTITENAMQLAKISVAGSNIITEVETIKTDAEKELIQLGMWASEPQPFDPMEIALHEWYESIVDQDLRSDYTLVHEYPLSGKPPMMTHVFKHSNGKQIIAAKGAPEAIMQVCGLDEDALIKNKIILGNLAKDGYRLLGVAKAIHNENEFPKNQTELAFSFKGFLAFYDPPKKNIEQVMQQFYTAGIDVKIITGDNAETTSSIAKQIGFYGYNKCISGDELMQLNDHELRKKVKNTYIFTRMFPEAKLRIINAFKANKEIVAMTGDGVNDGPALKAAHIGIAMGKKGSEIAKQAASLILLNDDLANMVDAVAMGRRIYTNLKKAIQYIISIHIPIILTVIIPLALGWIYPNIFSPIHIIFLELIMGPTCSIIYENEPMELNTMKLKPRPFSTTFFNWNELFISIVQGLFITAGTLFIYQYSVQHGFNESLTRAFVFTVLISANITLTLVNRSFYYSILSTFNYKNNLVVLILFITSFLTGMMLYIQPITVFFGFESLSVYQLGFSILIGFTSVIWFEFVKLLRRIFSH
jgi:Ca2+-transporting ATPase